MIIFFGLLALALLFGLSWATGASMRSVVEFLALVFSIYGISALAVLKHKRWL